MAKINWAVTKNLYDLEYQKTLAEYNNWLSSQLILTLTAIAVLHQVLNLKSLGYLALFGLFIYFAAESGKRSALSKLSILTAKIRSLAP